ncbi:hypothetical protein GCM10025859_25430 [Alicyclobacillus fastidiosus]|nr:hypothetical protein GCM10025859_25430 [Alicyclobacillus fastidiosus]
MHHTLMVAEYDVFRKMYEPITGCTAILTPENAEMKIPEAIGIAKRVKKPVYLVVAPDLVIKPVVRHNEQTAELAKTNEHSLRAVIGHVRKLLEQAQNVVILVDMKTLRYELQAYVQKLAEQMNVPAASMMQGKSAFDETYPHYIGMYSGAFGSEEVRGIVEGSDCVITVGLVWSDSNTGILTARLNPLKTVDIQPSAVKVGEATYTNIMAEDMLNALQTIGYRQTKPVPNVSFPYDIISGEPEQPITAVSYYPHIQRDAER